VCGDCHGALDTSFSNKKHVRAIPEGLKFVLFFGRKGELVVASKNQSFKVVVQEVIL